MVQGYKNGKIYKTHDINYVRTSHEYECKKKVYITDKKCTQVCVSSS